MSADRYAWMDQALCAQADPDTWTEPAGSGHTPKRICDRCPARTACDTHADTLHTYEGTPMHGIWGGRSRHQRETQRRPQTA